MELGFDCSSYALTPTNNLLGVLLNSTYMFTMSKLLKILAMSVMCTMFTMSVMSKMSTMSHLEYVNGTGIIGIWYRLEVKNIGW